MSERQRAQGGPASASERDADGGRGGAAPQQATSDDASPLASLRQPVENPHGFRGYGPLLALAVLVVLIVLLAPTVAPEEIVLVPTDSSTTTTLDLTP